MDDDEISYNTFLSRKLNRYGKSYYSKEKTVPSTDDSEETSKSKKEKKK